MRPQCEEADCTVSSEPIGSAPHMPAALVAAYMCLLTFVERHSDHFLIGGHSFTHSLHLFSTYGTQRIPVHIGASARGGGLLGVSQGRRLLDSPRAARNCPGLGGGTG